jgi:hypothetical protein
MTLAILATFFALGFWVQAGGKYNGEHLLASTLLR